MLSPPLDMAEKWFAPHTAYSMAKFGMSLVVLGLAGELRGKVAVNALWPRTTIATAAIKNLLGGDAIMRHVAQAGDSGRGGLPHFPQAEELYRELSDRRHIPRRRGRHAISTNTASTPASRCRWISSCPTSSRRRAA